MAMVEWLQSESVDLVVTSRAYLETFADMVFSQIMTALISHLRMCRRSIFVGDSSSRHFLEHIQIHKSSVRRFAACTCKETPLTSISSLSSCTRGFCRDSSRSRLW
jgi:hypothetical protein